MSKLKAPLLSLEAHGTLADNLTFQKRSGSKFVRRKPTPTDPKSTAQLAQRDAYQRAASSWNDLTDAQKAAWNMRARPLRITGFNLYMRYLLKLINNLSNRWAFMEGSGWLTHDSWGEAEAGLVFGASFVSSKWGYSLLFDGLDDRVTLATPDTLKVTSQDFSIIARVRPSTLAGGPALISNYSWSWDGFTWFYYANGRMYFEKGNGGVEESARSDLATVTTDVWQLLGVTRSGNNVLFYRNGIDVSDISGFTTDLVASTRNTMIGAHTAVAKLLTGHLDFLLFFRDIALSQAQMQDWAERTL